MCQFLQDVVKPISTFVYSFPGCKSIALCVCVCVCAGKMHVSLAEALEVRGGPLQEEEVWAVLSQSAESLQELFHKGMMNIPTHS